MKITLGNINFHIPFPFLTNYIKKSNMYIFYMMLYIIFLTETMIKTVNLTKL